MHNKMSNFKIDSSDMLVFKLAVEQSNEWNKIETAPTG
jgi:hypothetical protein